MKSRLLYTIIAVTAAIGLFGCGLGAKATPQAQATTAPVTVPTTVGVPSGGEITVVSTSSFIDTWGWYNVVGELVNNSSAPLTSIELSIELRDASGNSLLKDENGNTVDSLTFSPTLYTLAPGQYSPFQYSFDTASGGTPASFNVTVISQAVGTVDRAELAVENVEMVDDGNGTLYLAGELVNKGSDYAFINVLAGAALDANNQVLSTDWTLDYTTMLAPAGDANGRDRTPFAVDFPVPSGEVTQWVVYYDADRADSPDTYSVTVNLTNGYFDNYSSFHIVGTLTNDSTEPLYAAAIGGLYAEDGTTLDAYGSRIPLILFPGALVPFDLSVFSSVNWNSKQASRLHNYTVQVDPWSTYPPSWETVALSASNAQVQKDGASWTFTGNVVNDSGKELSGETVVIAILDAQNKLVATNYTFVWPEGDTFTNGATSSYEVTVYLDPNADTTGYTYQVLVQGDVK